jgi:hypothetical protein
MRNILCAMSAVAVIGFVGSTSLSAAPSSGSAIANAAQTGLLTQEVDCRRYPHRHRNAKPHGWGFGCPKRKAPKTKTQKKS